MFGLKHKSLQLEIGLLSNEISVSSKPILNLDLYY